MFIRIFVIFADVKTGLDKRKGNETGKPKNDKGKP